MNDAFPLGRIHVGGHGNHVLGIVVLNGYQVAELSVECLFLSNQVGCLDIDHIIALGAYKINLSAVQLPNLNLRSLQ